MTNFYVLFAFVFIAVAVSVFSIIYKNYKYNKLQNKYNELMSYIRFINNTTDPADLLILGLMFLTKDDLGAGDDELLVKKINERILSEKARIVKLMDKFENRNH